MNTDLERNKANVVAFYDLMFNQCQPAQAIERYAGAHYIQHNPHVADGKDAFVAYFTKMAQEYPGKHVEFKRVFADGCHVILHCHPTWPGVDRVDPLALAAGTAHAFPCAGDHLGKQVIQLLSQLRRGEPTQAPSRSGGPAECAA